MEDTIPVGMESAFAWLPMKGAIPPCCDCPPCRFGFGLELGFRFGFGFGFGFGIGFRFGLEFKLEIELELE